MPLRDFLQKKDQINEDHANYRYTTGLPSSAVNPVPEIRFVAPDPAPPTSNEPSSPPTCDDSIGSEVDNHSASNSNRLSLGSSPASSPQRRSLSFLLHRSSRSRSPSESSTGASPSGSPPPSRQRRLSNLLHRGNSGSPSPISAHIPADLPQIEGDGKGDTQDKEAQWERRATVLVQQNTQIGSPGLSLDSTYGKGQGASTRARSSSRGVVADHTGDVNIQEAIRLHETGELEASTKMFGKLADPNGANNALSQVLYGLALRHGWGCTKDPEKAISYLSAAASNSASVESEALQAGIKKGGAAKGELVLAIFELANCFRNGWGVARDPVAARQYFETAANLGDTDAMNEAAWCYLEGFGGKKDKFLAAKYYRLAEGKGNKLVGNSWIWKEKYNPK